MKNKLGAVLMLCGVILLAAAVPLIWHNQNESHSAEAIVNATLPLVKKSILQANKPEASQSTVWQAIDSQASVTVGDSEYLGILAIPSLSLELPIHTEWSEAALKTAPCRQQGSALTDDLVIAGHNYTEHFGRLDRLTTGETLTLTLPSGEEIKYTVAEISTLSPTAVDEVLESSYPLTLYTCTFSGRERIVVRCNRTDD